MRAKNKTERETQSEVEKARTLPSFDCYLVLITLGPATTIVSGTRANQG